MTTILMGIDADAVVLDVEAVGERADFDGNAVGHAVEKLFEVDRVVVSGRSLLTNIILLAEYPSI